MENVNIKASGLMSHILIVAYVDLVLLGFILAKILLFGWYDECLRKDEEEALKKIRKL